MKTPSIPERANPFRSCCILVISLLASLPFQLNAKVTVIGTVVENHLGGKGLAGARVRVETNDRISNRDGRFAAVVVDKKVGQVVAMTVSKPGFEVVNEFDLRMTIRKPGELPMTIILCEEGRRDHFAAQHYRINVERLIRENFKEESARIDPDGTNSEQKIRDLGIGLTQALKQVEDLSQAMARVRADEVTDLYREAFALFQEGRLDEADERLADAEIDRQIARDKQRLRNTLRSYLLKAQIRVAKFDFEGAEKYYQKAVKGDPTWFEALFELATYQRTQNKLASSIVNFRKAMKVAEDDDETAVALYCLADSQWSNKDADGARVSYRQGLTIQRRLAKSNPVDHEPGLANLLNKLGGFQMDNGDAAGALKSFQQSLAIRERLAKANPVAHEPGLATSLSNLGSFHTVNGNADGALKCYQRALVILKRLATANPATYEPSLALTLNHLGLFQGYNRDAAGALESFQRALAIGERLAKANPAAYEPSLAMTLNNLGGLKSSNGDAAGARKNYGEALELYDGLARDNPAAYEPNLARILGNLAAIQRDNEDLAGARKNYERTLELFEKLATTNPAAYESDLAMTLHSQALFKGDVGDSAGALKSFQRALTIKERLAETNPAAHEPDLAMIFNNLGILQTESNNPAGALKSYQRAMEINANLAKRNSNRYEIALARSIILVSMLTENEREKQKLRKRARSILEERRDDPGARPLIDFLDQ